MIEPTKEQAEQIMDRVAKGMTTVEDSDLMRKWICMLWEAQRYAVKAVEDDERGNE